MPSTQPHSPLGSSKHLSTWQSCPLGLPSLRAAPGTADGSVAAPFGSEGSARGEGHPSLSLMIGARVAFWRRLGCSLHHCI